MYISREKEFEGWMKVCDAELTKRHGMITDDIPDMSWWEWFEDEMTAAEAIEEALRIMKEDGWW